MKYLIFLWSNAIDKKKKASKFHDFDNEKIERMCFNPKRRDNNNKMMEMIKSKTLFGAFK